MKNFLPFAFLAMAVASPSPPPEVSDVVGHVKCQACTDALNFIKSGLESNNTESAIADKVLELCSNADPKLAGPCQTISTKIGPQVLDLVLGTLDPNTACATAGMC